MDDLVPDVIFLTTPAISNNMSLSDEAQQSWTEKREITRTI